MSTMTIQAVLGRYGEKIEGDTDREALLADARAELHALRAACRELTRDRGVCGSLSAAPVSVIEAFSVLQEIAGEERP